MLLVRLLLQLALDLGACAILPVNEIHLPLAGRLLLLVLNHHLNVLGFLLLNSAVVLPLLPAARLLSLRLVSLKLGLGRAVHFVLSNRLLHLLLDLVVLLSARRLLSHALLLAVLTLRVAINVATTLHHDVAGTLPRLINFADSLYSIS